MRAKPHVPFLPGNVISGTGVKPACPTLITAGSHELLPLTVMGIAAAPIPLELPTGS